MWAKFLNLFLCSYLETDVYPFLNKDIPSFVWTKRQCDSSYLSSLSQQLLIHIGHHGSSKVHMHAELSSTCSHDILVLFLVFDDMERGG